MKIYYLLKLNNYRIGFVSIKQWKSSPDNFKLIEWFFSHQTYYPLYENFIVIKQFYILGLGFGIKITSK